MIRCDIEALEAKISTAAVKLSPIHSFMSLSVWLQNTGPILVSLTQQKPLITDPLATHSQANQPVWTVSNQWKGSIYISS